MQAPFKKDPEQVMPPGTVCKDWEYRSVCMFKPHELLRYMFDIVGVEVSQASLQEYWSRARDHGLPWAQAGDAELRIPVKLFGDDAAYNQQGDKLMAFVISCPLWRPRSARNSRWPIAAMSLYGSLGYASLQPVLREIVASLNEAYDVPSKMGYKFQVTELGGDWKYMREAFNLQTHWNSSCMCHICSLRREDMATFPDPLPLRTMPDFIMNAMDGTWPSPLVLLRRFDLSCVQWCLLHTLHLGLLWTANGGALDYLLNLGVWGQAGLNVRSQLLLAYKDFKAWLKQHRVKATQRRFTVRMLYKASHGAYLSCKRLEF